MKKVLSTLAPLKKLRPGKKIILIAGYILVVAALITAVTWRNMPADPVEVPQNQPGTTEAGADDPALRPDPPFNAIDEPEVIEGLLPDPDAIPVLALPNEPMRWPLEGQILFGHHEVFRIGNQMRAHVGVDIEAPSGSEVHAAWPGIVELVTKDSRLGWLLEIRHGGGYITQYANLHEEPYVSVGDEVKAGDTIGKVGESAILDATEGAFLHFAVYLDNTAINPIEIISPR
jgi:murein DD-endopeptidase MepM/ murein hydrolase activator NlpD